MGMPAWEVPFDVIGKVLLAAPEAVATVAKDLETAQTQLPQVAKDLDKFLTDAATAMTDKGLNFTIDGAVAKDFLATLADFKALVAALK